MPRKIPCETCPAEKQCRIRFEIENFMRACGPMVDEPDKMLKKIQKIAFAHCPSGYARPPDTHSLAQQ